MDKHLLMVEPYMYVGQQWSWLYNVLSTLIECQNLTLKMQHTIDDDRFFFSVETALNMHCMASIENLLTLEQQPNTQSLG